MSPVSLDFTNMMATSLSGAGLDPGELEGALAEVFTEAHEICGVADASLRGLLLELRPDRPVTDDKQLILATFQPGKRPDPGSDGGRRRRADRDLLGCLLGRRVGDDA